MKITFLGATQNVTGSKFLLEAKDKKILIDCGLFQERAFQKRNWEEFPADPATIDAVLLTHAHVDHCAYLPKLVKDGFSGPIYCTQPTADITSISLKDSAQLQKYDALLKKKRHAKEGRKGAFPDEPLYVPEDVENVLPMFKSVIYKDEIKIAEGLSATFFVAGHILGAAMIRIAVEEGGVKKTIVFSGDIGRWDRPIIDDPHVFEEADYVVMEATYGDRLHDDEQNSLEKLARIVEETKKRGGNIVIPTFAIERAQELIYYFNQLLNDDKIPHLMTFLDSPMAIEVTKVFRKSSSYFDEQAKDILKHDDTLFDFPMLRMTKTSDESKAINHIKGTSIIMAGSGMCTGGRIKHHLLANISRKESTILFVGYQAEGTLGRHILERPKKVRIFGHKRDVKARIEKINGFSAHADRNELIRWLNGFKTSPKEIFIVHSEKGVAARFASLVRDTFKTKVSVPEYLQSFEI